MLKDKNKIIILTHNSHFYLNVKYNYSYYDKKNIFIRLESNGKNTIIKKLKNKDDDFKTNYEAL